MISQHAKDWYWFLSGPPCWLNLQLRKLQFRYFSGQQELFLNLGSGEEYIEGLLNIEGNLLRKKDLWLNIQYGLPFRNGQVSGIYLSHVLEHFSFERAKAILLECRRVLSEAGGIRILVPSLEKAIAAYQRGDRAWFSSFPDDYESLGGRFCNHMMCQDQHRLLLDFSFVEEVARGAGFSEVRAVGYRQGRVFPEHYLQNLEHPRRKGFCQDSLIVEAFKTHD